MELRELVWLYRHELLSGLMLTLLMTAMASAAGLVVGLGLAVAAKRVKWVSRVVGLFSLVCLSIPVIVLLYWAHFPLQDALGIVVVPFYTATAVLSVVNVCVVYELVTPALRSFPPELLYTARVLGLSEREITWRVAFPILLRQLGPALIQSQLALVHLTLLASFISVPELFRVVQRITAQERGSSVVVYTGMALLFALSVGPITFLTARAHARLSREFIPQSSR